MEHAWLKSEPFVLNILNWTTEAVIIVDSKGHVLFWNNGAETLLGLTAGEATGCSLAELVFPEASRSRFAQALAGAAGGTPAALPQEPVVIAAKKKNGEELPVEMYLATNGEQDTRCHAVILRDGSRIRELETELERHKEAIAQTKQAHEKINRELGEMRANLDMPTHKDFLTGMLTHQQMIDAIDYAQKRSNRSQQPFVLLMMEMKNLEQPGQVKDRELENRSLIHLATLCKETIRDQDLACRWGNRHFMFLLPETDLEGARFLAKKILRQVADRPFVYHNKQTNLGLEFSLRGFKNGVVTIEQEKLEPAE